MDRVYTSDACRICTLPPSMGWLYVCRQDSSPCSFGQKSIIAENSCPSGTSDEKEELHESGLSPSIVNQIEAGIYTDEQIEMIKKQKLHLREVISDQEHQLQVLGRFPGQFDDEDHTKSQTQASSSTTISSTESNTKSSDENALGSAILRIYSPCEFRCCHTCRPYFRDRAFASIDSVLWDEYPSLSTSDTNFLKVGDVRVVRNIGTKPNPQWVALPVPASDSSVGCRISSRGEEVEVPGGVALTEEAVGSQIPNIISQQ